MTQTKRARMAIAAVLLLPLWPGATLAESPAGYPPIDSAPIYRDMDRDTLVRAYADLHPEAAFMALYNAYLAEGSTAQNIGIMETSVDSRQIVLTANSETIYAVHPVDLSAQGGAVVLEVPAKMLGMVNAPGWVNISDIGPLGPDKGEGGTYVITAPGYDGPVPEDAIHLVSPANTVVWLLRGFVEDGDTAATVRFMQDGIRTYSLAQAEAPPETTFYNTSESQTQGHPMDMLYDQADVFPLIRQYFEMNGPPAGDGKHADIYSHLLDAGFFDGSIDPDLEAEAAEIGETRQRIQTFSNRMPDAQKWPGKSGWTWANNFADELFTGRTSGVYSASQHQNWSFMATFNAIGMTRPARGTGSQYIMATKDADGAWLDGAAHYTLTVPAAPPAKDFWSIILYNATDRSMLRNDTFRWGVNSYAEDIVTEADGAVTLHFAPNQPEGVSAANWIETNPGEGFFVWFRAYGPTDPWYDGSWVLPDVQKAG